MYSISTAAVYVRSRFWRSTAVGRVMLFLMLGSSGCQDSPLPTEPAPKTAPEVFVSRYPTEDEYAEMPAEFRYAPGILNYWVHAFFAGNRAYGQAGMDYFATDGTVTVIASLFRDDRHITSTTGVSADSDFLPRTRSLIAQASMGISGTCGYLVNANGKFHIFNKFLVKGVSWLKWGDVTESDDDTARLPACTCTNATQLTDAAYDPYSPGEDDGSMPCGDSNTGGEGSGIQYQPGDNTGGETVDWNTGEGNGGTSACGSKAVVEYVCLDTWNAEKKVYEQWGCGYVTMC